MVKGPNSADRAQHFLNLSSQMRSMTPDENTVQLSETEEGSISWDIPEPEKLAKSVDQDRRESVEEPIETLDEVYDAVKTTYGRGGRKNRVKGLYFLSPGSEVSEKPCSRRSWYNWLENYENAGLIGENKGLTSRGRMMIDTTEELNERVFDPLEISAGDAYRMLSTQKYNSTEENNGGLIKAFLMYPSDFGHTEIYSQEGVAPSTARTLAEEMDGTLYTSEYNFTEEGRAFGDMLLDQMRNL